MVVAACYESPSISKIISDFYLKRVNKKYFKNLSKEEKETISKIFNDLEKNPEPALNKIENPKDKRITVRLDNQSDEILTKYCYQEQIEKAEAVRRGILKLKSEIKK